MRFSTVAFDLDGTLTDPFGGLSSAFKYAFNKLKIDYGSVQSLRRFIGPPLREAFKGEFSMSDEQAEEAIALFREYFGAYGWWDNLVYQGIRELLSDLKAAGVRILLATSKPEIYAVKILKRFELYEYFDFIGAATTDGKRDTKFAVLDYVLDLAGCPAGEREGCVLVGDRCFDVEGARLCGIGSIGVLYGYGSREELTSAGADYIAESPSDIERIILS